MHAKFRNHSAFIFATTVAVLFTSVTAQAFVVCAKDDGTGVAKTKSKLVVRPSCIPGKEVQVGTEASIAEGAPDVYTSQLLCCSTIDIPSGVPVQIKALALPAGSYTLTAKVVMTSLDPDDAAIPSCFLEGGDDYDMAFARLETIYDATTLTMNASHTFAGDGVATLRCWNNGADPVSGDLSASNITITAVRAGTITEQP